MRQSPPQNKTSEDEDSNPDHVARKIIDMLGRLHVLVVGPGLGRDPLMQATVARVIRAARESNMPVVLDADALQVVQNDPDVVRGYKYAVLTPNVVEFKRLCDALKIDVGQQSSETGKVETLAKELGGVTIIQKGYKDFISNGKVTLVSDLEGGKKRSGGQGDTLTGAVATFLGWRKAYLDGLWKDHEQPALDADEMMGLAAFGGSAVTRVSFTYMVKTCLVLLAILTKNLFLGVLSAGLCQKGTKPASKRSHRRGTHCLYGIIRRGCWRSRCGKAVTYDVPLMSYSSSHSHTALDCAVFRRRSTS